MTMTMVTAAEPTEFELVAVMEGLVENTDTQTNAFKHVQKSSKCL